MRISDWSSDVCSSDLRRLTRGELPASIPVTADGEIGYLQQGFNAAADALRNADYRLQFRIEQALKLRRQNAALETASQARALFLAAASHDLRQPPYALTLFSPALSLGEKDQHGRASVRDRVCQYGEFERVA